LSRFLKRPGAPNAGRRWRDTPERIEKERLSLAASFVGRGGVLSQKMRRRKEAGKVSGLDRGDTCIMKRGIPIGRGRTDVLEEIEERRCKIKGGCKNSNQEKGEKREKNTFHKPGALYS